MPIQTYKARVGRVHDLTHDVREIDLRLVDPKEIRFKPGQFVSFELTNPKTGRLVTRPYSVASPPSRTEVLTLLFNRVVGGPGSTYLFSLGEGDETTFKGPAGTFTLRDDPGRALLFVATGTGIAPIRSMLFANFERHEPRPATLFWGVRSQRDLYYQDELMVLAKQSPHFTFVTTLSRPEAGWTGETGRVTRLVKERIASVANLAVYVCGNGGMIQDVTAILNEKGLCPIRREKYYDDPGPHDDY